MKQVIIPATVWVNIEKSLTEIKKAMELNDLVNREEACKILGISSKTMTNYLGQKKITPDSTNELNQPFFSRKKLLGVENSQFS